MKKLTVLLLVVLALPLLPRAAEPRLMDAVRAGDTPALTRLIAGGADVNAADETGATPLMYAAVYGSVADMTALIDRGANVNAANAFQSTALMWAAGDTAKVRLLLDRGANPDARAVDRTNALAVATRFNNIEAMRLLLAKGADPKSAPGDEVRLLRVAYTSGSPAVRQLLAERGILLKNPAEIGTPLVVLNTRDTATVKQLLDLGFSPREQLQQATLALSALMVAASQGDLETARLLIERGADPSAASTHGWTPLMMAAAAPAPNPAMVQLLIDKGADLAARDDSDRTALDWARTAGDTPMVALLRAAGVPSAAPALAAPGAVAIPRDARIAVEKAIARLQPISPTFYERNKCISCHHQSLPAMATKLARDRGVAVDRALASHPTQASLDMWKSVREQVMLGNGEMSLGGFAANLSYGMASMAEEEMPPNAITDVMAYGLAASQRPNGSFSVAGPGQFRPPLGNKTEFQMTALSIRALAAYAPPGRAADTKVRIARALDYVSAQRPNETQDHVFKLLGLIWGGGTREERDAEATSLLALQRADGGWGQLPTLASDAYATGQTLYALHLNGMAATADTYRKGADYLRRTQLEDGSWFVRSRAFGFQPYFDAGFPHGKDQFISAAATSWAAIALAYTL